MTGSEAGAIAPQGPKVTSVSGFGRRAFSGAPPGVSQGLAAESPHSGTRADVFARLANTSALSAGFTTVLSPRQALPQLGAFLRRHDEDVPVDRLVDRR